MRKHLMLSFVFTAVIGAAPATALDLPARKAGLWEITMTMEGRNIPMPTAQHCIDAETDKLMSSIGGDMRKDMCSKQDVQKVGNTFVVNSVCKIGASTTTSQAVVSGDFNSAYTVKVTSKREGGPAMPGMPAGRQQHHEHRRQVAGRVQGRPEAGRHDHRRPQDQHPRFAEHDAGNAGRGEEVARRSGPLHVIACEDLAHRVDQLAFLDGELRLGLLLQVIVAVLAQPCDLGAEDEVLDLDLALWPSRRRPG